MIQLHDLHFDLFISKEAIADRVAEIGEALTGRFLGQKPVFISILSGSFVFASDLIRAVATDLEIVFVKLASYEGTASSGEIQTIMGLSESLAGRHVVVIEDIVDSGRTLHFFNQKLAEKQPASITTAALLVKPGALKFPVQIDFAGFEIADDFVVGYGLDYDGLGRNLPDIYQLSN